MSASSTGTFGHSRGAAPRLAIADRPHHDGSPLFTDAGPYALGDRVGIRLRVPAACAAERVVVRTVQDGEPQIISARIDRRAPDATWWAADLTLHNPVTTYRFLLLGGRAGYLWSTAAGVSRHELTDAADHRLHVGPGAPAWLATTVGYQIFLDRFASSGAATSAPEWAIPCAWDDPVVSSGGIGTRQWFGGDLPGITANLDHLERLGVDLVYLTPFFPARSSHRYDAATFDHVDPLLGGDDALGELIAAAHRRRIRVIGDITLNHTGDHHDWFRRGRADRSNAEAAFYLFDDQLPGGYVSWHGVPSLPKLDHRDAELGRRLYRGPGSIVDRYLRAPFGLDGWRVDCANTTGRFGSTDLNAAVAAATAATARAAGDAWLVAEHCYDPSADLTGAGWHGVMAYQWFTRPLSSWLIGPGERTLMSQTPLPHLDGTDTVASIDHLAGPVAWTARAASMTMLDSHDTPRFRTVVAGDRHRHAVATAALVTMPGVPTLCAGSEVGVEGDGMDGSRVPFPWDESRWDRIHFETTRRLVALRRSTPALQRGSMRWIDATADTITYLRELPDETVLVHLDRRDPSSDPGSGATLPSELAGTDVLEPLVGGVSGGRVELDQGVLIARVPTR